MIRLRRRVRNRLGNFSSSLGEITPCLEVPRNICKSLISTNISSHQHKRVAELQVTMSWRDIVMAVASFLLLLIREPDEEFLAQRRLDLVMVFNGAVARIAGIDPEILQGQPLMALTNGITFTAGGFLLERHVWLWPKVKRHNGCIWRRDQFHGCKAVFYWFLYWIFFPNNIYFNNNLYILNLLLVRKICAFSKPF